MSEKNADENDKLKKNTLPQNPAAGTKPVGKDAPRVLTVKEILESAAKRAKAEGREEACTTGHYQLDDATGGIRPGKGWVFAAESSWGKSSWLVMVTDENLKRGKRVLIVTSEDDEDTYGARLLVRRSRVTARRFRSGKLWDEDEAAIEREIKNAENLPVYLDARGKSAEWTAKHVDAMIEADGIDLVAYDYLQEFSAHREQENHRLTVKYIAATLRKVVKLRKKASVIFSQITVPNESKTEYPNRNMIRDCRDVANAAEVILIGYTPARAVMDGDITKGRVIVPAGAKAIFVDKVKDGPKGFAVRADWDDDTASFTRMARPPKPEDSGPPADDPRFAD